MTTPKGNDNELYEAFLLKAEEDQKIIEAALKDCFSETLTTNRDQVGFIIPWPIRYNSGTCIELYITSDDKGFIVSDRGGAGIEAEMLQYKGIFPPINELGKSLAHTSGLTFVDYCELTMEGVKADKLQAAMVHVASSSLALATLAGVEPYLGCFVTPDPEIDFTQLAFHHALGKNPGFWRLLSTSLILLIVWLIIAPINNLLVALGLRRKDMLIEMWPWYSKRAMQASAEKPKNPGFWKSLRFKLVYLIAWLTYVPINNLLVALGLRRKDELITMWPWYTKHGALLAAQESPAKHRTLITFFIEVALTTALIFALTYALIVALIYTLVLLVYALMFINWLCVVVGSWFGIYWTN